jgi:hypothetical protein
MSQLILAPTFNSRHTISRQSTPTYRILEGMQRLLQNIIIIIIINIIIIIAIQPFVRPWRLF